MSGHYDYPRFKVAAVQAGSVFRDGPPWFDLESTLDKAIGFIDEAGRMGARLIVFPECYLPCYPHWSLDLTEVPYKETTTAPSFAEIWASFLRSSVEVPSRETEALCAAAKRANAYVVIGINERDKIFRGRMCNSILYLSPRGEVVGTHRKICPTLHERLFHTPAGGGDNLRAVFRTEIGYIGGSICGEHRQLMLIHNWVMQGIQIHCSLWPGSAKLETITDIETRAVCCIASVFGVLAAGYMPEQDWPKGFYRNSRFSVPGSFRGGSGVIDPYGEYIAGPVYDQEAIVYGDINLLDIDEARCATDLTGIYSRWDILSLNVQQETYEPLIPMEAQEEMLPVLKSNRIEDLEARIEQLEQQIAIFSREIVKDIDDK